MPSAVLDAALADIDTVFNGFASPDETGCGYCQAPEETAYLRTPYVRIPVDVVRYYLFEVSDHFDDHAAAMRRLLPQAARAMADGSLGVIGYGPHGLTRVDWRSWPAEQAAAMEAFLLAWWQDAVTTPEPPYGIDDTFDTCVTIARTVTPFSESRGRGPVADAHLVHCAEDWLYDLLSDCSPFSWWYDDSVDAGLAALRAWLAGPGAARLRAQGESDLALRCEIQALSALRRPTERRPFAVRPEQRVLQSHPGRRPQPPRQPQDRPCAAVLTVQQHGAMGHLPCERSREGSAGAGSVRSAHAVACAVSAEVSVTSASTRSTRGQRGGCANRAAASVPDRMPASTPTPRSSSAAAICSAPSSCQLTEAWSSGEGGSAQLRILPPRSDKLARDHPHQPGRRIRLRPGAGGHTDRHRHPRPSRGALPRSRPDPPARP